MAVVKRIECGDSDELVVRTYNAALGADVAATFRCVPGRGIEMRTPGGMGVLLEADDALRLYGWLGARLGNPEVQR